MQTLNPRGFACAAVEGLHVRRRRFAREQEAYGTRYSQAVSHPGTDRARPCLASEIGRDRACSGWCGRERRSPTVGIPLTPAEAPRTGSLAGRSGDARQCRYVFRPLSAEAPG